ncbi:heme/hemin ABC transporter substrate-binding protein [Hydrogenophaga sp. BPS33]|uniref:heme/hemin ABC transporter substrate-binding protein n=1 Tax=Hydrogenophaga sp. BPS33 TaxID=2651974 RepID=UPI00131F5FB0|nr:ABC transporter substrate-binding protein [Hydrogenophaga sp. BPS33]QHE87695.1 ABC transporter substrate-binding protein [Hydrogenophaga sp. BPS33]
MPTFTRISSALSLAVLAAVFSPLASSQALPAGWQSVAGAQTIKAIKAAPRLPVSAASDDGATVRVTDAARVIAGGDDVIDIMETLGLGDRVFAAPESAVTEAGRKAPRHFLFNRTTGAEGVLSLDGTLFLGNSLRRHAKLSETLRATALPAVVVDDLQPAPQKIRKVAAVFGLATEGEALAKAVQQQLDEAAAIGKPLTKRARVIHVSATGGGGKPTVGGKDTAAAQLIRLAGGINIGDAANTGDYTALSNEGVVAAMPEVVLITRSDLALMGGEAGLWRNYPTLKQTPAGQANRVWVMPDVQLKIVGSQSGAGAIALAQAFKAFATKTP